VKFASRKKEAQTSGLYVSKCYELANYYLGFNTWNTSIASVIVHTDWSCSAYSMSCCSIVEMCRLWFLLTSLVYNMSEVTSASRE